LDNHRDAAGAVDTIPIKVEKPQTGFKAWWHAKGNTHAQKLQVTAAAQTGKALHIFVHETLTRGSVHDKTMFRHSGVMNLPRKAIEAWEFGPNPAPAENETAGLRSDSEQESDFWVE
jgi:hypothetical protein